MVFGKLWDWMSPSLGPCQPGLKGNSFPGTRVLESSLPWTYGSRIFSAAPTCPDSLGDRLHYIYGGCILSCTLLWRDCFNCVGWLCGRALGCQIESWGSSPLVGRKWMWEVSFCLLQGAVLRALLSFSLMSTSSFPRKWPKQVCPSSKWKITSMDLLQSTFLRLWWKSNGLSYTKGASTAVKMAYL